MYDHNYWKEAYKDKWDKSDTRERTIQKLIQEQTGKDVKPVGFGTGTANFLSGSAESYGYEKGDADLEVVDTNIKIEVTGPLVDSVPYTSELWIRPDKIENARKHLEDHDTWVVHCLGNTGIIRVIRLDREFFESYDKDKFKTVHPFIGGKRETYAAILHNDNSVQDLGALITEITSK